MAPIVNFGKITAGYGRSIRFTKTPHTGVDFCVPSGTPLHAPLDGVISRIADYGDTSLGKAGIRSRKRRIPIRFGASFVGQQVHHGDIVAISGSSARSTGPHLHFGVFNPSGAPVDPGKIDFTAFTAGGDHVLVKINGVATAAANPFMDWLNHTSDSFIQWEAQAAANGFIWSVGQLLKMMAPMVPELAGFSIMVLITIGMFTDFAKWLARSLLVFMGAVLWITLAHA